MRFLVMYNGPLDPNGGSSGTVWQSNAALKRSGHDVDMVGEDDLKRRISHPNLNYAIELPYRMLQAARERLDKRTYDTLLISQPYGYLVGKWLHQNTGSPVYLHRSHGHELVVANSLSSWEDSSMTGPRPGWRKLATRVLSKRLLQQARLALKYADGTIVPSSFDRDFLVKRIGVSPKQVRFIPHASVPSYLEAEPLPYTTERHRKLLYVGNFTTIKGGDLVWQAGTAILRRFPGVTLTIVTQSKDAARVAAGFGEDIRARVHIKNWLTQDALMSIYDEHGILLVPSRYEGASKAHYEGMSRGLCLVCSSIGAMLDSLVTGENGLLVGVGDAEGFTNAVSYLLDRYEVAKILAGQARKTSLAFTWDRNAQEIVGYATELMAARQSRSA